MGSRWSSSDAPRGAGYDERFERLAAAGHDIHGEASLVAGYEPRTVLDAGCGTGRVAIELARRGVRTMGVDLDRAMLERAAEKSADVHWLLADLATLDLRTADGSRLRFHVVVAAGNVMIFVREGTEAAVVEHLADHIVPGGLLVSGFQLLPDRYGIDDYDRDCGAAGLTLYERFSSWTRDPWDGHGGYAVSAHRKPPE